MKRRPGIHAVGKRLARCRHNKPRITSYPIGVRHNAMARPFGFLRTVIHNQSKAFKWARPDDETERADPRPLSVSDRNISGTDKSA